MPRISSSGAPPISLDPSPFSAEIAPRPQPARSYSVHHTSWSRYPSIDLTPTSSWGAPAFPELAEAGKPFVVDYQRGLSDLGQQGELKKVTLHYRIDGGPVKKKVIADGQRDLQTGQLIRIPAKLAIPATAKGEVEYWFSLESKSGGKFYDSDYGKNFHANIVPAGGVMVKLDDLWGDAVSGPIKAGGTLRIAYDVDRLKQFLQGTWHHGAPTWNIMAYVSFDGQPPLELPVTIPNRGDHGMYVDMVPVELAVEVPSSARQVSLWFRGSSYGGSVFGGNAWDSRHGANYNYPVEP